MRFNKMSSEWEKLIARILFIPVTGVFVFLVFTQFAKSLNDIIYSLTEDSSYHIFLRFDTRDKVVFWLSVCWIISNIVLEIVAYFSENFRFRFPKLLTNLRYAPIVGFILSWFLILIYDAGRIEYSKQQIRNYIFADSQSIKKPDFPLYNNYRHWCGNGAIAQENYLYFGTASEGINDENPYVRARSLLMSSEVNNFFNGGDERFENFLANSCRDSDQIVREAAESYLNDRNSTCQK